MNKSISFVLSLLIFLTLLLPIFLISILIILKDREYPLYFSFRIGRDNKAFLMPKLMTMLSNTPQQLTHLLKNPDNCILSIGRFLRKSSLNEFPQII
jgi:O-antigen biosynthesis protein WbqP